jgi:ABC-type glycerol-3-phosphate transport system substrate-binding protein
MKKFLLVFALLCCTTLVFARGREQSSASSGGLTTIKMFQLGTLPAGIQKGFYWTDVLAEDLGVQLDIVPSTADTLRTMIAARDLPEVVISNTPSDIIDIIRAGLVRDLEPYKDRIPNVFKWTGMIQFMKDNWSEGQGKVYAIRGYVSNVGTTKGTGGGIGPYVRDRKSVV